MPTSREAKKKFVADINALANSALLAVTADYRGLNTVELTELRARAAQRGVSVRVVKNTLVRRALQGTAFEGLGRELSGTLLIAFSHEEREPGAAARVIRDYCRDYEKLELRSVSLVNEVLSAADIDRLADLPTREEALAKIMGLMRAPMVRLLTTMQQIPSRWLRLLTACVDQKKNQN